MGRSAGGSLVSAAALVLSACSGSGVTSAPAEPSAPTISISLNGCGTTVHPPAGDGWTSCHADITVHGLGKRATSGTVTTMMNWGCAVGTFCSAYYHGDAVIGTSTPPSSFTVSTTSTYLPRANCTTTMHTTVDLYDGPQNSNSAPLLYSIPVTLSQGCG